jgi:trehalose 6-phosphate phosphatase
MADQIPLPASPGDWALFLDIDGTLLDLAPTPTVVVVPKTLPHLLDSLTRHLGGALALVSGRCLADIDRLFPGGRDVVGSHGSEWRLGGRLDRMAEVDGESVFAMVEAEARTLPGIMVERKGYSMALHFRNAPDQEQALRRLAQQVVGPEHPSFTLMSGKGVLELVPVGSSKGEAIDRLMGLAPYSGRVPVFIGDDVTDESGFGAVNRMGGVSVHVGPGLVSKANLRVPSPEAVRQWLARLEQHLGAGGLHAQS